MTIYAKPICMTSDSIKNYVPLHGTPTDNQLLIWSETYQAAIGVDVTTFLNSYFMPNKAKTYFQNQL